MKIAAVQTTVLSIPLPKPIEGGRFIIASADPILVQVRTDEGLVGFGYALTVLMEPSQAYATKRASA